MIQDASADAGGGVLGDGGMTNGHRRSGEVMVDRSASFAGVALAIVEEGAIFHDHGSGASVGQGSAICHCGVIREGAATDGGECSGASNGPPGIGRTSVGESEAINDDVGP